MDVHLKRALLCLFVFLCRELVDSCPIDMNEYYNLESNAWVCCQDITCGKGHEPVPCDKGNTTSWCRICGDGFFNNMSVSLSDRTRNKCRSRKRCDFFFHNGDASTDATCYCPEKWHHLEDDAMCRPNRDCLKGYGQTNTGHCVRCKHGVTFSNEANNHQRCMPVRRCRDEYRCTVRVANISSNAICTKDIISDIDHCPHPSSYTTSQPSSVPMPDDTTPDKHAGGSRDKGKENNQGDKGKGERPPKTTSHISDANIAIACFGCLIVVGICVLIVFSAKACRKERFKMHLDIVEHLETVILESKRQQSEKVFNEIYDYLTEEKCQHWESLALNLMGEKLSGVMSELRGEINDKERMHRVLYEWKEMSCTDGPNIRLLITAMYSPEINWCIPYAPLRTRIIDTCDLAIIRDPNIPSVNRLCRGEWDGFLPCDFIRRLCHQEPTTRTSTFYTDQSAPPSTVNSSYALVPTIKV